jgi:hypothetical protein
MIAVHNERRKKMPNKEFRSGSWLFKEGAGHGANVFRLIDGSISVYEGDQKIASVEVREGQKPRIIGVLSALIGENDHVNKRHVHTTSVAANTDLNCETIEITLIKRLLRNDLTDDKRGEIDNVVKAIIYRNKIKEFQGKLANLDLPTTFEVPEKVSPEISEVLDELRGLYESTA